MKIGTLAFDENYQVVKLQTPNQGAGRFTTGKTMRREMLSGIRKAQCYPAKRRLHVVPQRQLQEIQTAKRSPQLAGR